MKELLELLEKHENINADELSSLLSISSSNVKRYISEIKGRVKRNGANISSKSGRGNGYCLEIFDFQKYRNFIDIELQKEIDLEKDNFLQNEKRIFFLAIRLLSAEDYLLSQNLADEEGISLSQFSKELKIVKDKLSYIGVSIVSVPHHGLKVVGSEQAIRSALSYYLLINENDPIGVKDVTENSVKTSLTYRVGKILENVFNYYQYPYDVLTINNILIHLIVMCKRLKAGNVFLTDYSNMQSLWEYPIAVAIASSIQKEIGIDIPDSEVNYIAMHLISKELSNESTTYNELKKIIDNSLVRIYEELGYDLKDDVDLKNMLLTHTVPMLERAKYNTTYGLIAKPNTKEKFLAAESCAITFIDQLNKLYDIHLPYDEIWYCTLHFDVALRKKYFANKKALVVTGLSRSNVLYIKSQLDMYFNDKFVHFDYVDYAHLQKNELTRYDFIFSTFEGLKLDINKSIYYIPAFLNKDDLEVLNEIFYQSQNKEIKSYLPNDFLIVDDTSKDKQSALKFLYKSLNRRSITLPNTFEKDTKNREEIRKYTHGKKSVLIQSVLNYECDPCIYIDVLKEPILWETHYFNELIIICCSKKDIESTFQQLKLAESILISDELNFELEKNPNEKVVLDWLDKNIKKKKKVTQIHKIS